jgi:phage terminase small subunit
MAPIRLRRQYQRFVDEYLLDLDAKNAAIRAGYGERNAHANSYRLLRRPDIAAAVEQALAARQAKTRLTGDRVLAEYGRMAFANMRDFAEWGPHGITWRPNKLLAEEEGAAIAELQGNADNSKIAKLKLYDKKAALDALARHLGLFDPKARMSKPDQTIDGREAREVLRERLLRLARRGGNGNGSGAN